MATNYWEENYQPLVLAPGQSYQNELLPILTREEGVITDANGNAIAYFDTANPPNATIGYGVNITLSQNMALVLQTLGAINAGQTIIQQETIVNQFEAVLKGIAGNPSLSLQNNLDALLQFYTGNPSASFSLTTAQANDLVTGVNSIVNGFTITASDGAYYAGTEAGYVNGQPNGDAAQLTAILNANGSPVPPNSREYLALMSLYYNGGSGLIGPNLRNALATGNRAAAWYEIRYDSNGSGDFNTAKRRYYESTLFGLYSNPSSPALTEAFQAYQVLQEHRSTIMAYEDKWGLNPDGTAVPAIDTQYGQTALQSVMTDYSSILSQAGISTIPTLGSMYNPAENTLFQELSAVFPEIASSLTVGNAFAPTNVFVGDSAPGTSNGPDNAISTLPFQTGIFQNAMPSLLLAGSGNDTLSASSGDSVLIAGAGNDVLNANAVSNTGTDTLIGGAGNDTLNGSSSGSDMFEYNPIVVGPNGTQAVAGGIETINDPTGEGTVWANSGSGVMQLVGGKPVAGTTNTWVDADGNQYQYSANTTGNTSLGTLTVTSSAGKEEIVIQDFNLNTAETNPNGELGIKFAEQTALSVGPSATADSFASGNYAPSNVTATTLAGAASQTLTVSLSAVSDTAQQITLNFSGTNTAAFAVDTGANLLPITNGAVTLTVPAGMDSLTVGLIATETLATNQTLDITASLPNAPAGAPAGNSMQVNFAASLMMQVGTIAIAPTSVGIGGDVYSPDGGNDLIQGTSGNDTVYGESGLGDCIIAGNGGQDLIYAFNNDNQIYANQPEDLATALSQAATQTATGEPGSIFDVGDFYSVDTQTGGFGDNTLVGGTGNDQFYLGGGADVVVCGPGNDTIEGGQLLIDTAQGTAIVSSGGYSPAAGSPETATDSSGNPLGIGNETIFGGTGDDFIQGSNGDNYIDLGSGNSTVYSGSGNDTIFAGTGNSAIVGQGGNDFIEGESGNDVIVGGAGNNTILAGSGNDTIAAGEGGLQEFTENFGDNYVYGGSGNSLIEGTGGNDTLIAGSGSTTVIGGAGNELIEGGSGQSVLVSGSTATGGSDTLIAGSGNNSLYGGAGTDALYGGDGTDLIQGGSGSETIYAGNGGTSSAPTQVEAGSGTATVYAGAGVDQIIGGSGEDTLIGGSGDATLRGGSSSEVMQAGAGNDVLIAGSGNDTLYGGIGASTLQGGSGATQFVAGAGQNVFIGGGGQNTYELNAGFGNVLIEPGTPGDTIEFGSGITLADLAVTGGLDAAGAPVLQISADNGSTVDIVGGLSNGALGEIAVGSTDYTLLQLAQAASNGDSEISGASGNLIYSAGAGDAIFGGSGNDTLAAFGANTTLTGGTGDTLFFVNDPTEVVTEASSGLNDTIESSVNYVLPENVDTLTLTGATDLTATGNGEADLLTANAGNDTLIAGTGVATMVGGAGNDTFVVDNAADVVEAKASGVNTVLSSVSYVQPQNVENLTLTGTADLTATGTGDRGVLTANSGNDTLIAGAGAETLVGGAGNDTFVVNNAYDVVQAQASGVNSVATLVSYTAPDAVRNLIGTGTADLNLIGGALTDTTVVANSGNDTLQGGSASGTLVGGSGLDTFVLGDSGDYIADKASGANAIVQLHPGFDFSGVTAQQSGNDLVLQAGASSLRLTGYFLDPQDWKFEDSLGNTIPARTVLGALSPTTPGGGQFSSSEFATDGVYSTSSIGANGEATINFYNAQNVATGSTTYSIPTLAQFETDLESGYGGSISAPYNYSLTSEFGDGTQVNAQTVLGPQIGDPGPVFYTKESVTQTNGVVLTHGSLSEAYDTNPNQYGLGRSVQLLGGASIPYSGQILSDAYYSTSGALLETYNYDLQDPAAQPTGTAFLNPDTVPGGGTFLVSNPDGGYSTYTGPGIPSGAYFLLNTGEGYPVYEEVPSDSVFYPPENYTEVATYANGVETLRVTNFNQLVSDTVTTSNHQTYSVTYGANGTANYDYIPNGTYTGAYTLPGLPQPVTIATLPNGATGFFGANGQLEFEGDYSTGNTDNTLFSANGGSIEVRNSFLFQAFPDPSQSQTFDVSDGRGGTTQYVYTYDTLTTSWANRDGSTGTGTFDLATNSGSETVTYFNGSYSTATNDGLGGYTIDNYNADGTLASDQWGKADGSTGTDTFNPNGSSSGKVLYPNGSTSTYTNDGAGDVTTDYYSPAGVLTHDAWTQANGSHGTDTFNADGSSSGIAYSANGAYTTYTNDGAGDLTTLDYNAQGQYVGDTWARANGSHGTDTFNAATDAFSGDYTLASGTTVAVNTTPPGGGNVLLSTTDNATLAGGSGADSLFGFGAADTLTAGTGNSLVYGSGNGDVLVAGSGNDTLIGTGNNDTFVIDAGSGIDTIIASGANDTIEFGPGINPSAVTLGIGSLLLRLGPNGEAVHLEGFDPANALNTGSIATFSFADGTTLTYDELLARGFDLYAGPGNVSVGGTNLVNRIYGGSGNDTLIGTGTADTLTAGTGVDTLIGGAGNETYIVNNVSDVIEAQAGAAGNTVLTSVSYTAPANVTTLTGTGSADLTLTGNALNDVLTANAGNDTLVSGSGVDTLIGGAGNDTFVVNNSADVIEVQPGAAGNTVLTSVSYTAPANVTTLTGTGSADITLTGNAQNDVLTANAGNDTLVSGSGVDTLIGGAGADTFVVDNASDVVDASAASASNTVLTSVSHVAPANVTALTGTGSGDLTLTANDLNDVLTANAGSDTLVGGGGNDTFVGGAGNDTFIAGPGADTFIYNPGNGLDSITAGAGTDTVRLGAGLSLANVSLRLTTADGEPYTVYADGRVGPEGGAGWGEDWGEGEGGGRDQTVTLTAHLRVLNAQGVAVPGEGLDFTVTLNRHGEIVSPIQNFVFEDGATASFEQTLIKTRVIDARDITGPVVTGRNDDLIYAGPRNTGIWTGSGNDTVYAANNGSRITGGGGDDLLVGGRGEDTLSGGYGTNVILGGGGNDVLSDPGRNSALLGGSGNDTITTGAGNDFISGGAGDDLISTGATHNVVAFNAGDGRDTVFATPGAANTLSLGGPLQVRDLRFSRDGNNLVLNVDRADSVTFQGWYADTANHDFVTLQIIGGAGYGAEGAGRGADPAASVRTFDFATLVNEFNAARAADPALKSWALADGLGQAATPAALTGVSVPQPVSTPWEEMHARLDSHLQGNETVALGGALAYAYAEHGNLGGMDLGAVQATLKDPQFGVVAQSVSFTRGEGQGVGLSR